MAPLSMQISDAAFSRYVARALPPYADTASLYHLFGVDQASSVKNRLPGKADASVIGTPVYGANYARTSKTAGFLTPVVGSSPWTFILVTTIQVRAIPMGHWNQGVYSESGLFAHTALDRVNLAINGSTRVTHMQAIGAGQYHFWAGAWDGASARVGLGAAGVFGSTAAAYAVATTSEALRIGAAGYPTDASDPQCDVALAAMWPAALTPAQLQEIYDFCRETLALRGVTVI